VVILAENHLWKEKSFWLTRGGAGPIVYSSAVTGWMGIRDRTESELTALAGRFMASTAAV